MGRERLLSLDVFRGITIAAMILVNDPGSWSHVYAPLLHAKWHGYTPTDLIFPFFIFIMGVAIALSSPKSGDVRKGLMKKSYVRALKLFGLGLFLNAFPHFELESLRIPGVLQRLALVFIAIMWIYHYFDAKKQYWIGGGLLVLYWVIMMFIPVPGGIASNLEPGTNFAAWFDELLLSGHMWSHSKTWDPEGVLSTLPAIVSGLIGIWTGRIVFSTDQKEGALLKVIVLGNIALIAGMIWGLHFPVNKSLWTSSFVLVASGWGMILFGIFFWVLDVLKKRSSLIYPFQVFGMNAITVYVFAGIMARLLSMITIGDASLHAHIYEGMIALFGDSTFSSLFYALVFVSVCYLPVWILYKKGIFIKV